MAACGADQAALQGEDAELFVLIRSRGESLDLCGAVAGVQSLDAVAQPAEGGVGDIGAPTLRPDCGASVVRIPALRNGVFDIEVSARGNLRGAPSVLYATRERIVWPSDRGRDLILEPRAAFLDLSWTAPEAAAGLCAEGVDQIRFTIDDGIEPSVGVADCGETSLAFQQPLPAGGYTLTGEALGSGRARVLFRHTEERFLDPGLNEVGVVLQPTGARLELDWSFEDGGSEQRGCDRVGVSDIRLTARVTEGPLLSVSVPCAAERPFVFPGLRLRRGEQAEVRARAVGNAIYRGGVVVMTPPSMGEPPAASGRLVLAPHGSLAFSWYYAEDCRPRSSQEAVGITVLPVDGRVGSGWQTRVAGLADTATVTPELPYGFYIVTVAVEGRADCAGRAEISVEQSAVSISEELFVTSP